MFGRIGMSEYNRRGACYRGVSYAPLSYYGSSYTDLYLKTFERGKIWNLKRLLSRQTKNSA